MTERRVLAEFELIPRLMIECPRCYLQVDTDSADAFVGYAAYFHRDCAEQMYIIHPSPETAKETGSHGPSDE